MGEELTIRPYARLITMLGDQLIKNEKIALIELIKNSYDADAAWIKVSFHNFGNNYEINDNSSVIIEDDGNGMNRDILVSHWLNPATPVKLKSKAINKKTQKGRIVQGEKGIGRFAIFKLGKKIRITTRRQLQDSTGKFIDSGEDKEYVLSYDFSKYDADFLSEDGVDKEILLENLKVTLDESEPKQIVPYIVRIGVTDLLRKPYGTRIEITDLKTRWSEKMVSSVISEVAKMQPIFTDEKSSDFLIGFYKDETLLSSQEKYKEKLLKIMNEKAVFKLKNGWFDSNSDEITFKLNDRIQKLNLRDAEIAGMRQYSYIDELLKSGERIECGSFGFEYYFFDFNAHIEAQTKYCLDKDEKELIKNHRTYVYRDGIRVMPYGDPEDDWLKIDVERGTVRANEYLSNDQVIGCIYITQEGNKKLKDKTNREGLLEDGHALSDFICINQLILGYIRKTVYARYLIEKEKKEEFDRIKKGTPDTLIEQAKKKYANDENTLKFLADFESSYKKEKKVFDQRIHRMENLAATGLAIETASHDVNIFMKRSIDCIDSLINYCSFTTGTLNREEIINQITQLRGNLSIIATQLKDIQTLFPSAKLKTKNINVRNIVEKIYNLYRSQIEKNNIKVDIISTKNPLIAKTTDAVLLQVFINLFDNSLYWLKCMPNDRNILISIDGDTNRVIFSDNGPGINKEDKDYIFEAFYSGKGEEGKGLGLYIARQLLDRYEYTIDLAEFKDDMLLDGANFVLEFVHEE